MKPKKAPATSSDKKKWAVILAILFIFVIIGSFFLLIHHAEKRVEQAIIERLNSELSDGSEIIIEHFNLSLFPLGITAKNIELHHHISFEEREPRKQLDLLRSLKIQEFSLKRFRLWRYIKDKHVEFDNVIIHGAETEVVLGLEIESSGSEAEEPMPPIYISEFQLIESDLFIFQTPVGERANLKLGNYSVYLTDIEFSDHNFKENPKFEDFDLQVQKLDYFFQNGQYELQADSMYINSFDSQLQFKNAHLKPLMSATELADKIGHQLDRFDIKLSHFLMKEFDLKGWLSDGQIYASNIELTEPTVYIDRDKSYPRRERNEDRILPAIQFKQLDIPVQIDTIHAISGSLKYHEIFSEDGREGFVQFDDIDLKVSPFQNTSQEDSLFVRAEAQFMDSAQLNLNIDFSLGSDGAHIVSGTLGTMDLSSLNEPLDELILMRIESGQLDQLNFWFYADNNASAGNVIMIYRDLEVRYFDDEEVRERRRDRFRSFIANTFVIRSNNPSDNPRTGEIQYVRDPERSMFSYWLRSLATGLEETVKRL